MAWSACRPCGDNTPPIVRISALGEARSQSATPRARANSRTASSSAAPATIRAALGLPASSVLSASVRRALVATIAPVDGKSAGSAGCVGVGRASRMWFTPSRISARNASIPSCFDTRRYWPTIHITKKNAAPNRLTRSVAAIDSRSVAEQYVHAVNSDAMMRAGNDSNRSRPSVRPTGAFFPDTATTLTTPAIPRQRYADEPGPRHLRTGTRRDEPRHEALLLSTFARHSCEPRVVGGGADAQPLTTRVHIAPNNQRALARGEAKLACRAVHEPIPSRSVATQPTDVLYDEHDSSAPIPFEP